MVIFAFDSAAGVLETYCPSPKAAREWVEGLFADRVLGAVVPDRDPHAPVYELDARLDLGFAFPTDPADEVRRVRAAKLRIALPDSGRRVELEGDPAADPEDALVLLNDLLPPDRYPRHRLHVVRATFVLTVRPPSGGRDRTLTFDVSYPNSCSLKSVSDDRRAVGDHP